LRLHNRLSSLTFNICIWHGHYISRLFFSFEFWLRPIILLSYLRLCRNARPFDSLWILLLTLFLLFFFSSFLLFCFDQKLLHFFLFEPFLCNLFLFDLYLSSHLLLFSIFLHLFFIFLLDYTYLFFKLCNQFRELITLILKLLGIRILIFLNPRLSFLDIGHHCF